MRIGITLTSSLEVHQKYLQLTESVATSLARQKHGIVYGGTAFGMMVKLAESYKAAGGSDLCGVMSSDLIAATPNCKKFENLDEEYLVQSMEDRKAKIISLSDAYLILPGGYGTFEEIGSIIGGQANKLYSKPIGIYNFEGFYDPLFAFLSEIYAKQFSKIDPYNLFFASSDLDEILNFFHTYSPHELSNKFV